MSGNQNSGNKIYLPHTYHDEKWDGCTGRKVYEICPAAKNIGNNLTSEAELLYRLKVILLTLECQNRDIKIADIKE